MENLKNIPKLRFPEFTGEWEDKKLGDITTWASGGTPPKDNPIFWDGNIPWISASSMRGLEYSDSDLKITEEGLKKGSKLAKEGTLLILVRGSMLFNKIPIGIAIKDVAFNQDVKSIEVSRELTSCYLLYWMISNEPLIMNMVTGTGIGAGKLDLQDLKALIIKFPSLPEQTKIANFLTAVDDKLSSLKKKKQLLEQYKKGVMQQIFSQQLRFKDDNGEDFAEWEEKKFSEYIKLYRGSSPRPIVRFITESADGINWIKIGDTKNVEDYIIKTVSEKITIAGSLQSRKVEVGELILANSMSFGKTYKLNISGCIYDGWFVLREYEKFFDKSFLMQLLNSEFMQKQYKTLSTGGVVQNISSDIVYSTNLLKPSLPEQTKIANFLSAIDEKISHCGVQIEKMEGWKKGLLQQMFV